MKSAYRVPIRRSDSEVQTMPRGILVAAAFDYHHSLLPLHLVATLHSPPCFSFDQLAGAARYVPPFASSAQAVRAVLFAMATVTIRVGLRISSDLTQAPVLVLIVSARRVTG